jgi:hypothetical protein
MKSVLGASVAGCLALACSGESAFDGEVGDSQQQAFGIAQCAKVGAVMTHASRFNYSTAGGYGTGCHANDVTSMHSANRASLAFINGPLPTNEADCLATFILADLYAWQGSRFAHVREITRTGVWSSGSVGVGGAASESPSEGALPGDGVCSVAVADFGKLAPGVKYRIAATARTYTGSSFTALPFVLATNLEP